MLVPPTETTYGDVDGFALTGPASRQHDLELQTGVGRPSHPGSAVLYHSLASKVEFAANPVRARGCFDCGVLSSLAGKRALGLPVRQEDAIGAFSHTKSPPADDGTDHFLNSQYCDKRPGLGETSLSESCSIAAAADATRSSHRRSKTTARPGPPDLAGTLHATFPRDEFT